MHIDPLNNALYQFYGVDLRNNILPYRLIHFYHRIILELIDFMLSIFTILAILLDLEVIWAQ